MTMRSLSSAQPHADIWLRLSTMRQQSRLPQALLIIAPPALLTSDFLDRLLTQILCLDEQNAPCGHCKICEKILQDTHPDIYYIRPDNPSGPIKIEQIRDIQPIAYQSPQLGTQQVMVIHPAEAMNQAAASALLKVLEEPTTSTLFILVTNNVALLLPTIISRCQQWHVSQAFPSDDPLLLGQTYPDTSARGKIFAERFEILENLDKLLTRQLSPSALADQWSEYPTQDMLWFFSSLLSKLIQLELLPHPTMDETYQSYALFKQGWRPECLFEQLDSIYAILSPLQANIHLNATMIWERIFLRFLEGSVAHVD